MRCCYVCYFQCPHAATSRPSHCEVATLCIDHHGWHNLFDKVYYQRVWATYGSNYYGEPRNVMVTLRGRF